MTKATVIVGTILLVLDGLLILYWLFGGIYVAVSQFKHHGEGYLIELVLVAFHFTLTIAICAILHNRRKASQHAKSEPVTSIVYNKSSRDTERKKSEGGVPTEFLLEWAVAIVIAFGTDTYSLIALLAIPETIDAVSKRMVISMTIWGLVTTVLSVAWTIWIYFEIRSFSRSTGRRPERVKQDRKR